MLENIRFMRGETDKLTFFKRENGRLRLPFNRIRNETVRRFSSSVLRDLSVRR